MLHGKCLSGTSLTKFLIGRRYFPVCILVGAADAADRQKQLVQETEYTRSLR